MIGVLAGLKAGTATITGTTLNGIETKFYIVVKEKLQQVTKEYKDITLIKGSYVILDLTDEELKEYSFNIADATIALITNGTIYSLENGTTTISVTKRGVDVGTFSVTVMTSTGCKSTKAFNNILTLISCISILYMIKKKHE